MARIKKKRSYTCLSLAKTPKDTHSWHNLYDCRLYALHCVLVTCLIFLCFRMVWYFCSWMKWKLNFTQPGAKQMNWVKFTYMMTVLTEQCKLLIVSGAYWNHFQHYLITTATCNTCIQNGRGHFKWNLM